MKNEKGITLTALLLLIIIALCCILVFKFIFNNTTENTNANNNNYSTSTNINNKTDSNIIGSWQVYTINSSIIDDKSYSMYIFNEDGTGSVSTYGANMEFTYKTNFNKISITYKGSTGSLETEYSIKDGKLYIGNDIICTKIK